MSAAKGREPKLSDLDCCSKEEEHIFLAGQSETEIVRLFPTGREMTCSERVSADRLRRPERDGAQRAIYLPGTAFPGLGCWGHLPMMQ